MAKVKIPTPLRVYTENKSIVEVEASTVKDALFTLQDYYPELKGKILDDDGNLKGYINIFIGTTNIKEMENLNTKINKDDTIAIIPAIAGGL